VSLRGDGVFTVTVTVALAALRREAGRPLADFRGGGQSAGSVPAGALAEVLGVQATLVIGGG
jgi:hypothetical protein